MRDVLTRPRRQKDVHPFAVVESGRKTASTEHDGSLIYDAARQRRSGADSREECVKSPMFFAFWPFENLTEVDLIVSGVLLVVEAVVLFLVVREPGEREKHIRAVKRQTNILGREAYVSTIEREVRTAKKQIHLYWYSLHDPETSEGAGISKDYELINKHLLKAHKKKRDVTLIVAKETSRIAGAYKLRKKGKGVQIYFQEMLHFTDLRFSLFDEQVTVFGTPGPVTDSDTPSHYGVDIRSHMLAVLMEQHFKQEQGTGACYEEYVAAETYNALHKGKDGKTMISKRLGIPPKEIDRCQAAAPHACVIKDDAKNDVCG
jgi:hypothetical protein